MYWWRIRVFWQTQQIFSTNRTQASIFTFVAKNEECAAFYPSHISFLVGENLDQTRDNHSLTFFCQICHKHQQHCFFAIVPTVITLLIQVLVVYVWVELELVTRFEKLIEYPLIFVHSEIEENIEHKNFLSLKWPAMIKWVVHLSPFLVQISESSVTVMIDGHSLSPGWLSHLTHWDLLWFGPRFKFQHHGCQSPLTALSSCDTSDLVWWFLHVNYLLWKFSFVTQHPREGMQPSSSIHSCLLAVFWWWGP